MQTKRKTPGFHGISGVRTNGKLGRCEHTCDFCSADGPVKMLVGASPNPALRDKVSQRFLSASQALTGPVPYLPVPR